MICCSPFWQHLSRLTHIVLTQAKTPNSTCRCIQGNCAAACCHPQTWQHCNTLRSSLPGLRRAGSKVSGLLVAIRTLMLPLESKPSSWLTISSMVRCTSLSPPVEAQLVLSTTATFTHCILYTSRPSCNRRNKHLLWMPDNRRYGQYVSTSPTCRWLMPGVNMHKHAKKTGRAMVKALV